MSNFRPEPPCVRCGKPQTTAPRPFCSAGCKDRDLLDWLDERHILPVSEAAETLDNPGTDA